MNKQIIQRAFHKSKFYASIANYILEFPADCDTSEKKSYVTDDGNVYYLSAWHHFKKCFPEPRSDLSFNHSLIYINETLMDPIFFNLWPIFKDLKNSPSRQVDENVDLFSIVDTIGYFIQKQTNYPLIIMYLRKFTETVRKIYCRPRSVQNNICVFRYVKLLWGTLNIMMNLETYEFRRWFLEIMNYNANTAEIRKFVENNLQNHDFENAVWATNLEPILYVIRESSKFAIPTDKYPVDTENWFLNYFMKNLTQYVDNLQTTRLSESWELNSEII